MEARHYLGGNPTGRGSLWCARFMNMVLARTGHRGTGSDMASSFASYGHRVSGPEVGAIAVMGRRGGGHVGIITGIDAHGNPIMISGNNGNRVKEAPISRGRIYAYVMPNCALCSPRHCGALCSPDAAQRVNGALLIRGP